MPKPSLTAAVLAALGTLAMAQGACAADVGVAIEFSEPGVYGRVDIGQYPQPQLLAPEPVLVERGPAGLPRPEPVYLWVPPEHRAHWERYCRQYHACGHPVYFVNHDWYRRNVMAHPVRREERREERHEERHDDRREEHRDDHDRGRGEDNRERGRDRD